MDSGDGYEICQFNIHTELTFAAKIDTIGKGIMILSRILSIILFKNIMQKYYVDVPTYPSYKGLELFLSKALICVFKCYNNFIHSQVF